MKRNLVIAIMAIAIIVSGVQAFQLYPYGDCETYYQPSGPYFQARMWGVGFLIERETESGYTIALTFLIHDLFGFSTTPD